MQRKLQTVQTLVRLLRSLIWVCTVCPVLRSVIWVPGQTAPQSDLGLHCLPSAPQPDLGLHCLPSMSVRKLRKITVFQFVFASIKFDDSISSIMLKNSVSHPVHMTLSVLLYDWVTVVLRSVLVTTRCVSVPIQFDGIFAPIQFVTLKPCLDETFTLDQIRIRSRLTV